MKVSKKAAVNDTSSHHGSGAEEVPSDRTDCVVQNVRSDKHHSGRVDDVVSNTRSENRQKGVISADSGLENVPPPANHPPDDSSSGQRELPGDTSLENRARYKMMTTRVLWRRIPGPGIALLGPV